MFQRSCFGTVLDHFGTLRTQGRPEVPNGLFQSHLVSFRAKGHRDAAHGRFCQYFSPNIACDKGFWLIYGLWVVFVTPGSFGFFSVVLFGVHFCRFRCGFVGKSRKEPLWLQSGAWVLSEALFLSSEMNLGISTLKSLQVYSEKCVHDSKHRYKIPVKLNKMRSECHFWASRCGFVILSKSIANLDSKSQFCISNAIL